MPHPAFWQRTLRGKVTGMIETTTRRVRHILASAALAALCLACPRPAQADPALWVAHGPHADVYLLGSIHLLRPDTPWEGPAIRHAFDVSSQLWVEAQQPKDMAPLQAVMVQLGLDPSTTLTSRLSPEDAARLEALGGNAMERMAMDRMRPWLASLVLALQPLARAGYDGALGADHVLMDQAHAAGKPVAGFETMEQQMRILAGMPEPFAMQLLHSTLEEAEQGTALVDTAVASWLSGDENTAAESLDKRLRQDAPDLYQLLITDRNAAWADRIAALASGTQTVLVTVGAGHVAGTGNLRDLLSARGLTFERVP